MRKFFYVTILLFLISCIKKDNFEIKWQEVHGAFINEKAYLLSSNEIAGFMNSLYSSELSFDLLEKKYLDEGYEINDRGMYEKENITVNLIKISDNKVNILIQVKP